jgi:predicted nucleic acid-binding protein
MPWVMDCSIAGALGLPDELSPRAEKFLEVMLADTEVWVPPLWWYEMSNLLVAAVRRRRLTQAAMAHLAELYASLPLRTDAAPSAAISGAIQRLAIQQGLSAYDAAYLELAHRLGTGLATIDRDLERAAKSSGVPLFEVD